MFNAVLLAALAGLLMLVSALLLFLLGQRTDRHHVVAQRLDEEIERWRPTADQGHSAPLQWLYRLLQRAGLARRPVQLLAAAGFIVLLGALSFLVKGVGGLLTASALFAITLYAFALWRAAATRETLRQQLPGFIDQLIRAMGVGRSFESALLQAIDDSPHPLSAALESVKVESSLGGDVADSLKNAAELYRMKELHLLTLALRINRRYGGSIKAMLENIIAMIRHREQAERELRALTGETRLSAWVLGTIPVLMAAYMLATNPTYIGYLLNHPHGMAIIYTALGLQATGALLLWRMMRSIR